MKTKHLAILLFLSAWMIKGAQAQVGFSMPRGVRHVDIPFEYINNFIILTVNFNGPIPLRFIYDTGAEHTILSKREISDALRLPYEREFRVKGSDLKSELVAYLVRGIYLAIPGKRLEAPSEDLLVLKEDYFRFEEYAGIEVHGILAGRVFSKYLVKINYHRKLISLYERNVLNLEKDGYTAIPVEIFRNKIYLNTEVRMRTDSSAPVKLLLDTGAGMPIMLFTHTHPLIQPSPNAIPTNIGMGLGGYLEGYVGRIDKINLGNFEQKNILTYFQSVDSSQDLSYLNERNGLIGNTILNRFNLIVDYQKSVLWVKPAKNYAQAFVYDRSGINLIATGYQLNRFSVLNVLPNSPADEAGIYAGDVLIKVNWMPTKFLSLASIQRIFQRKPGTIVKVKIKREGKVLKKKIILRDLI